MTHKDRIETAWAFREADRVPIEISISPEWRQHPLAERLMELIHEHADNFVKVPGPEFGFMGLPNRYTETVVEKKPGEYEKRLRVRETPAGTFTAITYHPDGVTRDFHWEKRYVSCLGDLEKLALAPRTPALWDRQAHRARTREIGGSAMPYVGLFHPLGSLTRNANMEKVYTWFHDEPGLAHRYLTAANAQVVATIEAMQPFPEEGLTFLSSAHEMLIPPWMGHRLFDEFVFSYDEAVYQTVHKRGGRIRAHCHGKCMGFLEKFAQMGIDAIEPLECAPRGDVDLSKAKRLVGKRMLLSGNVVSEDFFRTTPDEVRERVRRAIRAGARGGGFTLRTSGGAAGTGTDMPEEDMMRVIRNCETYILAGLEFGQYPIPPA
ncbi:MAG: hypothetical protein NTW86_10015 [Candidatus Sumerlaeota bacterium]|nr:hypothetical protein [Candidatus Sumerlaeota bacterium]